MFVATIGDSDRAVRAAIDKVACHFCRDPVSCSVGMGVAIACWQEAGFERSVFEEDYAYVGTLRGGLPAPGVALRGDFAFVARCADGLRLARARFAGRPLYWMRIGPLAVACSRLLPLGVLAGHEVQLNVDHLLALFEPTFLLSKAPLPFAGVERVLPNTVVDITATGRNRIHVGPIDFERELAMSPSALAGAVRDEFAAAVARGCEGVRRVAVLAGGGVDSSNLLAAAVQNGRGHAKAEVLPLTFDYGGLGDDRPHLRKVCSYLGVEPLRIYPSDGVPYAGLERVVDGTAQGVAPQSSIFAAMTRARAAGVERVLAGDGSELLLNAAPSVFGDFFLSEPMNALRCAWRFQSIGQTRAQSWRRLLLGPVLRQCLPGTLRELRRQRIEHRAGIAKAATWVWAGPRLKASLTAGRVYPSSRPIQSQRVRVMGLASSVPTAFLREFYSRWEIACGMPISLPYLDDDFVRFMARVPSAAVFAGARERGLLRESMEGLVPDSVRYRMDKARPDQAFADLFCAMGGYEAVRDLVTMRELDNLGIVDSRRYRTAFDRFAAAPHVDPSSWGTLWPAITAEAYVRWFNEFNGRPVPPPRIASGLVAS